LAKFKRLAEKIPFFRKGVDFLSESVIDLILPVELAMFRMVTTVLVYEEG